MGRTVMRSVMYWKRNTACEGFRKGLSKEDQVAFDQLFDRAKFHTAAGVYMAHPYPLETILLSILLEHEKMIGDILGKIKEREKN